MSASLYQQWEHCAELSNKLTASPAAGRSSKWTQLFWLWTAQELLADWKSPSSLYSVLEGNEFFVNQFQAQLGTVKECLESLSSASYIELSLSSSHPPTGRHRRRSTGTRPQSEAHLAPPRRTATSRYYSDISHDGSLKAVRTAADTGAGGSERSWNGEGESGWPWASSVRSRRSGLSGVSQTSGESTSSAIVREGDEARGKPKVLERVLSNLIQLSTLCRRAGKSPALPGAGDCPELFEDKLARVVYIRAWDTVTGMFERADAEICKCQAVAASIAVADMLRAKPAAVGLVSTKSAAGLLAPPSAKSPSQPPLRTAPLAAAAPRTCNRRRRAGQNLRGEQDSKGKRDVKGEQDPKGGEGDMRLEIPKRVNSNTLTFPDQKDPLLAFAGDIQLDIQDDREDKSRSLKPARTPTWYPIGPYVCVFKTCKTPYRRYQTDREWREHAMTHCWAWVCPAQGHGKKAPEFQSRSTFEVHMQGSHGADKPALACLAWSCLRVNIPEQCRLCSTPLSPSPGMGLEAASDHFLNHMADHFQALNRNCVAWIEEYEPFIVHPTLTGPNTWLPHADHNTGQTILSNDWVRSVINTLLPAPPPRLMESPPTASSPAGEPEKRPDTVKGTDSQSPSSSKSLLSGTFPDTETTGPSRRVSHVVKGGPGKPTVPSGTPRESISSKPGSKHDSTRPAQKGPPAAPIPKTPKTSGRAEQRSKGHPPPLASTTKRDRPNLNQFAGGIGGSQPKQKSDVRFGSSQIRHARQGARLEEQPPRLGQYSHSSKYGAWSVLEFDAEEPQSTVPST